MKNVYCVDDGGECWWYIATSKGGAIRQHKNLNYGKATGVEYTDEVKFRLGCAKEKDDKLLAMEIEDGILNKTAKQWAQMPCDFLGCSAL